jgi:hypothetical protein
VSNKKGVVKVAASRLGLTLDEYLEKVDQGLKWCTSCKKWLHISSFTIDKSRGDGRTAACRNCRNPRKTQGPGRAERAAQHIIGLAWCRSCQDWLPRADVRQGICKKHAAQQDRERYARDPKYRAERQQHVHSRKRNILPIPAIAQEYLLDFTKGLCAYCNADATTWDHVVPVSKGGNTTPGNILPACTSCNSSKGNRDVWDWITATGRSLEVHIIDWLALHHHL